MNVVDLVAPSGPFEKALLPKIRTYLLEQGLKSRIPEQILGEDLISANSDEMRFKLLQQALFSDKSDLIWCVRGGCGAARLLPRLKELEPPKKQKAFIGFSDITALHLFLNQVWGWQTIHGAGARQVVEQDVVQDSVALTEEILDAKLPLLEYTLRSLNQHAEGLSCEGALTGGNLKIVESSLGTFWQIESQDKIVLLEEVNEYAYRVDRSLVHLLQAGVFEQAKAVVFGDFIFNGHAGEAEKIAAVLHRFANELDIPVFSAPFFGHGKVNSPWIYGQASIRNGVLVQ